MTRRDFLLCSGAALAVPWSAARSQGPRKGGRAFTLNLVCGAIGVTAKTQAEVNALAHRHGFESVEARAEELSRMTPDELSALLDDMGAKGLVFGAAFLPNGTRPDAPTFDEEIRKLPALAVGLRRAGVTRIGTWISPGSDTHTYLQNFRRHVERVGEIARILDGEGVRLGLEYIGTPTLRRKPRHAFIHTMAEMKELLEAVTPKNVGFILDSWHWYTAGEGEAEIMSLKPSDIIAVDLNDAPAGVPVDEQIDSRRELPATTGVIDMATFITALARIGYDGPARAEPFNAALNAMENDEACAATIEALRRAVAMIRT
ncbi:MAG TPA: sugar phosphate isomerase/epimerase family protein [Vicinamibacterales bacterium]